MKNTYIFPAIFNYADDGISISFPDLPGCLSCADGTEEAVKNAKEVLGLFLCGMEDDNENIPRPSDIKDLVLDEGDIPLLVDVFMPLARSQVKDVYVKKTLTIPSWLNELAKKEGINFSETLKEAILKKTNHK